MPKHEFGIMPRAPRQGKRYDEYKPHKYSCISVDDDNMKVMYAKLENIDFYWHTLSVKGKGLAYCGITLIPPESLNDFIKAIDADNQLLQLKQLLENARNENKWVIHFGI